MRRERPSVPGPTSARPAAALAAACFLPLLSAAHFIRDDAHFLRDNPLLQGLEGLRRLWTTGYVEAVQGAAARVGEYRPVTSLSLWLDVRVWGLDPGLLHVTSLALHAANALLLGRLLARWMAPRPAALAAMLFAAMPVHAEALGFCVNRTELLAAFFTLSAWLLASAEKLSAGRAAACAAAFAAGLLSKESAIAFPAILAVDDFTRGRLKSRAALHAALWACAGGYIAVRLSVLEDPFSGGAPYFQDVSWLRRALTVSRFWFEWYLIPAVFGGPLAYDFARPWRADSGPGDAAAWAACLLWAGLAAAGVRAAWRRRPWAVWALAPFAWLAPTSHLILPLDTLGAQRLFYLPSVSCAAALAWALTRLPGDAARTVPGIWVGLFAVLSVRESLVFTDELKYYQEVVRHNPVSSGARVGLGTALLNRGAAAQAEREFLEAARLNPSEWGPFYNLGKLAFERGDGKAARGWLERAAAAEPRSSAVWDMMGVEAESRGDAAGALKAYRRALELQPLDRVARFNAARLLLLSGKADEAREHLDRFLADFPADPDAPAARAMRDQSALKGKPKGRR